MTLFVIQVDEHQEEEEERRRAERGRLTTTGRMPWRTVKLGSLVLIGAWTISLAPWWRMTDLPKKKL